MRENCWVILMVNIYDKGFLKVYIQFETEICKFLAFLYKKKFRGLAYGTNNYNMELRRVFLDCL